MYLLYHVYIFEIFQESIQLDWSDVRKEKNKKQKMDFSDSNTDLDIPLDDTRVIGYDPLIPPQILQIEHPLSVKGKKVVAKARSCAIRILTGEDDRLLVIVGPCSIHDPSAALEYGERLRELAEELKDNLLIVMRSYFEKPRTTVGWKGLINDPDLDGSCKINSGLRKARRLLCDLVCF